MFIMISTTHIFALLTMCFAGLAPSKQTTIENNCKQFTIASVPAVLKTLHRKIPNKCYVLFGSATYSLANSYCKQHVPDGYKQGQLLVFKTCVTKNGGYGGYGGSAFKYLTKCEDITNVTHDSYFWTTKFSFAQSEWCELTCDKSKEFTLIIEWAACSANKNRKFICEYESTGTTTVDNDICVQQLKPRPAIHTTTKVPDDTDKTEKDGQDSGSTIPTLAIVAAVIVILFGAAVLGAIIALVVWNGKRKQKIKDDANENDETETTKPQEFMDL